jgi:hypothetical protein
VPERPPSSLDRFLTNRAPILAGILSDTRRIRVLTGIGAGYGLLGLLLLLSGAATGNGGVAGASTVFLSTGIAASVIAAAMRARFKPDSAASVTLSPEATALVRLLLRRLYRLPLGPLGLARRLRWAARRGEGVPAYGGRSVEVLTPEAFRILDAAAREYNRIHAALGQPGDRPSALERFAPNVRAAADETIAELLHLGALLNRLPEAGAARENEAQARIAELRELAHRVEQLGAADAVLAGEAGSRIQSVLSDLRGDQQAREELSSGIPSAPPGEEALLRLGRVE